MNAPRTFGLLLLVGTWTGAALAAPPPSIPNQDCLECHRQPGTEKGPKGKDGQPIDMKRYALSAHADVACVKCHADAKADSHGAGLAPVACGSCHAEEAKRYQKGAHAEGKKPVACADCHGTHDTRSVKDPESQVSRANLPATCGNCHDGKAKAKGQPAFSRKDYESSVHFRGMTDDGLTVSATCNDCHGGHDMASVASKSSPIFRDNVPKTCGQCHDGMFEQYMEGAHGVALAKGNSDTPVCTDCHGEHGIRDTSDPKSSVFATAISKSTCPQCHSAEHVNRRYGLATTQVEGYRQSFHGLADQFGDTTVANCASCHGGHLILNSSNPKSSVNKANLAATCGTCHPGASDNFAAGSVHNPEQASGGAVIALVKKIYIALITLTIGGMLAYNGLDYLATLRERLRQLKKTRRVSRFTLGERVQHLCLVVTFFVLVISGFSLRYPDAFWVKALSDTGLSFAARGYAHRVAAAIFVVASLYHLYYLFATARGRSQGKAMLPNRQDLRDLWHQLRYYVGLEAKPGHFGRYSYVEKVEYLALIWGSIVMVVTGFIMWFEVGAMRFIPMWGWDLAALIHLYEAWLATLSILVWHLYHVAFKPSGHGVSLAMYTGELSEAEMKHEHPQELETLGQTEILPPEPDKEPSHDTPTLSRPLPAHR